MYLSEIIVLGSFLTLSIGEPIPIPRPDLIKPRCDNHTEPPYPYSFGTSAGGTTGASGILTAPTNPAGTGNPTLSSNSGGGATGLSGVLPSSHVLGQANSTVPVVPLTTGSNPSSTNSTSAPFPVTSNGTLIGTFSSSGVSGSSIKNYYYRNPLSSGLTGTGIGPTAARSSITAIPTGASSGTGIGPLSTGVSSANGSGPFGNFTSSGFIGTGVGLSTISNPTVIPSGVTGISTGSLVGTGIGPLSTGASSATGAIPPGNLTSTGFIGTGTGVLIGTGSIGTGVETVPTVILTLTEFPPFPILSSSTGVGGSGRTVLSSPTNSTNVLSPTSTGSIIATVTIDPSLLGSSGIKIPLGSGSTGPADVTSIGISSATPPYPSSTSVTGTNPSSSGVLPSLPLAGTISSVTPPYPSSTSVAGTNPSSSGILPSLPLAGTGSSVPPISISGSSQGTGNTAATVPPLTLSLTVVPSAVATTFGVPLGTGSITFPGPTSLSSTSVSYRKTSGGAIQGTGNSVLVVLTPSVDIDTFPLPSTAFVLGTGSITALTPLQTLSSTLLAVSPTINPGGPIQTTVNTTITVPLPSLSFTISGLPSGTAAGGLTKSTGTGTLATPVPSSISSGGSTLDTSIIATVVPPPSLGLDPSIPLITTIPVNITSGVAGPTGVSSEPGPLSASSSSSATGTSSSYPVTPTTFDTITKSSGTSTLETVPTVPVHHRKPYGGSWRNVVPSDTPSYAGYGYKFANRYRYHYD